MSQSDSAAWLRRVDRRGTFKGVAVSLVLLGVSSLYGCKSEPAVCHIDDDRKPRQDFIIKESPLVRLSTRTQIIYREDRVRDPLFGKICWATVYLSYTAPAGLDRFDAQTWAQHCDVAVPLDVPDLLAAENEGLSFKQALEQGKVDIGRTVAVREQFYEEMAKDHALRQRLSSVLPLEEAEVHVVEKINVYENNFPLAGYWVQGNLKPSLSASAIEFMNEALRQPMIKDFVWHHGVLPKTVWSHMPSELVYYITNAQRELAKIDPEERF